MEFDLQRLYASKKYKNHNIGVVHFPFADYLRRAGFPHAFRHGDFTRPNANAFRNQDNRACFSMPGLE
jgi:hypothetical protein